MKNIEKAKNYQKKLYTALGREWNESSFRDYWEGTFFGNEWDYLYDNGYLENDFCAWCGSEELNNGYSRDPHFSERRVKIFICDDCFMRVTGGNVPYKLANGTSRSGCFIATAVYGDYYHPSVIVLRNFRDMVLNKNKSGRIFTHLYYKLSPHLAVFISKHPALRKKIKVLFLSHVVYYLHKKIKNSSTIRDINSL